MCRPQHRPRIDQVLQDLQLQRRAAGQVTTIRQNLNRQLTLKCLQDFRQTRLSAPENRQTGNKPLECPQSSSSADLPRRCPRQMAQLRDEARQNRAAEIILLVALYDFIEMHNPSEDSRP